MKRILCALIAGAVCSCFALGLSGCGCSDNKGPGYKIEATSPDLEDGGFGFFIINSSELMVTKYTGSAVDIEIPEEYNNYTVTAIGSNAFAYTDIETVTMPDTVTQIKDYAFSSCTKLKSVTLSENLEVVGNNAFYLCSKLEEIDIPASVKDLGMYTFSGAGLKSVEIPKGNLTSLNHYVFYQCPNLTQVTLPETITKMEKDSIFDCPNPVTIKSASGSYAEKYAKEYGFTFEAVK